MINTQALLAEHEPGSSARVDSVLNMLDDSDTREALVEVLTFSEVEPLALLALCQGGARNRELAQEIMRDWATVDSDAHEYMERLELWDITPTHGFDEAWEITEGAS